MTRLLTRRGARLMRPDLTLELADNGLHLRAAGWHASERRS